MPDSILPRLAVIGFLAATVLLAHPAGAHPHSEVPPPHPPEEIAAVEESFQTLEDEASVPAVLERAELGTVHEREFGRLRAASFLVEHGTEASRPLLEELLAEEPELVLLVPGCREPVPVARYPYHLMARQALRAIDTRRERERLEEARNSGRLQEFAVLLKAPAGCPSVTAGRAVLGDMDQTEARQLAEVLLVESRTREMEPGGQLFLAEVLIAAGLPPDRELAAAWHGTVPLAVLERIRVLPAPEQGPWLEALAEHHQARSAVRLLLAAEMDADDPLGLLKQLGAEGATRLARHAGDDWPGRLAEQVLEERPGVDTVRHAAMALMLAGTPEAAEALQELARAGVLPPAAREEVNRWLAARRSF